MRNKEKMKTTLSPYQHPAFFLDSASQLCTWFFIIPPQAVQRAVHDVPITGCWAQLCVGPMETWLCPAQGSHWLLLTVFLTRFWTDNRPICAGNTLPPTPSTHCHWFYLVLSTAEMQVNRVIGGKRWGGTLHCMALTWYSLFMVNISLFSLADLHCHRHP